MNNPRFFSLLTVLCLLTFSLVGRASAQERPERSAALMYVADPDPTQPARLVLAGLRDEQTMTNFVLKWQEGCADNCGFLVQNVSGFDGPPPQNPGRTPSELEPNTDLVPVADLLPLGPGSLWIRGARTNRETGGLFQELSFTNFDSQRGGEGLIDLGLVIAGSTDFGQLQNNLEQATYVAARGSGPPKNFKRVNLAEFDANGAHYFCDFTGDGQCNTQDVDALMVFDLRIQKPCDFNSDGNCDQVDEQILTDLLANGSFPVTPDTEQFDLNGDETVDRADLDAARFVTPLEIETFDLNDDGLISIDDVDLWRAAAGIRAGLQTENGMLSRYVLGDANLDGEVQFSDFVPLAENFGLGRLWSEGNFDDDGVTQFDDFVKLAENFGQNVMTPGDITIPVPEPSDSVIFCIGVCCATSWLRRRRRSATARPRM